MKLTKTILGPKSKKKKKKKLILCTPSPSGSKKISPNSFSNTLTTIIQFSFYAKLTASLISCKLAQISNMYSYLCYVKEELHNRFNLISDERVKISKHNSENLMKIGWKIRKLWHFEVSQIFTKHFLTSQYEYANEWVWCHHLTTCHIFCT